MNAGGPGGLTIRASTDARPGGTIVGVAPAAALVASGKFTAGPDGRIALTGATVDVTSASFDIARVASCP